MDFGAFAAVLAVNMPGPLRVLQAFVPRLEAAGGNIVTITSRMGSLAGTNDRAVACRASKAAVNKVTASAGVVAAPDSGAARSPGPGAGRHGWRRG